MKPHQCRYPNQIVIDKIIQHDGMNGMDKSLGKLKWQFDQTTVLLHHLNSKVYADPVAAAKNTRKEQSGATDRVFFMSRDRCLRLAAEMFKVQECAGTDAKLGDQGKGCSHRPQGVLVTHHLILLGIANGLLHIVLCWIRNVALDELGAVKALLEPRVGDDICHRVPLSR